MNVVLDEYPSWDRQVARLETQYVSLYRQLRVLRDRLITRRRLEDVAERLRVELEEWMDAFVGLHREERDLVLEAVTLEVGAGD